MLSIPLTPLIGRQQEVAALQQRLRHADVRLLTVTGPGGVGKTRLALQAAADLYPDFPDGVTFISLAALLDAALVVATIAEALGLREEGNRPLIDHVQHELHDKRQLLVLDNFEHLLPAAPQLAALLSTCPALKLLVTSRASLHVRGEYAFPVAPLALPLLEPATALTAATITPFSAIQLFCQQAKAIKPDFELTDHNAAAVAEICARLDGLPLSLELAAARIKLLPPQAMLNRLAAGRSARLQLLNAGALDAPARQQTLRDTIDWSYQLLELGEQRIFRRLCVFAGGCTLAAAEAVGNLAGELPTDVLTRVASLIDKNLLRQETQLEGEPRLFMLETMREYALEQLAVHSEEELVRRSHAAFYLDLAETAEAHLTGPQQRHWFDLLESDHNNLRGALQWSLDHPRWSSLLRFGGALWRFWYTHGHMREGQQWLARIISASEAQIKVISAQLPDAATTLLLKAASKCFEGASLLAGVLGEYSSAQAYARQALQLGQLAGDEAMMAGCLLTLGNVTMWAGDYALSYSVLEESNALFKRLSNAWGIARSLAYLAFTAWFSGDYTTARRLYAEAVAHYQALGDEWGLAFTYYGLGFLEISQGNRDTARDQFQSAMTILEPLADRRSLIRIHAGLGWVAESQGDYATAYTGWLASYELAHAIGEPWSVALVLEGLAGVAAAEGRYELAVQLCAAAATLRASLGVSAPVPFAERTGKILASIRQQIGPTRLENAWSTGQAMRVEDVVAAYRREAAHVEGIAKAATAARSRPIKLSAREIEVLNLVEQGLSDAEVAQALVISVRTVNFHLQSIYNKLGVNSRTAAVHAAMLNKRTAP